MQVTFSGAWDISVSETEISTYLGLHSAAATAVRG